MNTVQEISGFLTAYAYENITVSTTAIGFTSTLIEPVSSVAERNLGKARMILVTLETANVRYRFDGGNPVATSSGHLWLTTDAGLTFSNLQAMKAARFIRETGADAVLRVTYLR